MLFEEIDSDVLFGEIGGTIFELSRKLTRISDFIRSYEHHHGETWFFSILVFDRNLFLKEFATWEAQVKKEL